MQQNNNFNEEPISLSYVALNNNQKNAYSHYRIPYLLVDNQNQQDQSLLIKSDIKADQYIGSNRLKRVKNQKRVKSEAISRNEGSNLPSIQKNGHRQKIHFVRGKKTSALTINSPLYDNYLPSYNPQKRRSLGNKQQQPSHDDYLKKLRKKQRFYENKKYLMNQPRTPFVLRNMQRMYGPGISKQRYPNYIQFADLKTKFQKDRRTLTFIYYSFRRENTLKGKLEMRIPKIPPKQGLQEFIDFYIPNNHQIKLNSLLKTNFCVIQYSPKQIYIGQMIGKNKDGLGIQITQRHCFEGEWRNNQRVKGLQITLRGVYKGTYLNNLRSGNGQFQRHTGQLYVGEWLKGKKHGNGLWINTQGQSYRGQWKFGKPNGHGLLSLKQRTYNGYFVEFKQEGFGREFFTNGDSYQGIFRNDLPEGQGLYKWKNGSRYIGRFENGIREGNGELYFKDTMIYRGYFKDDRPQGQCQVIFSNGNKYHGKVQQYENITLVKSPLF